MQIIPARKDYVGESLREFNESKAPERFSQHFKDKTAKKEADKNLAEENQYFKDEYGLDLSNVKNPLIRKELISSQLRGQEESVKFKNSRLLSGQESMDKYNQAQTLQYEKNRMEKEDAESKFNRDRILKDQEEMDKFNKSQELQFQKHEQEKELEGIKLGIKVKDANKNKKKEIAPFQSALKTIDTMEKIISKGNVGLGSKYKGVFSPNTREDRAKYQQLGNSLISMASTIPIRNKVEFEQLTGHLNDPDITTDEMKGVLSAMRQIVQQNMEQFDEGEESSSIVTRQNAPNIMKSAEPKKPQQPWTSYRA